MYAPLIKRLRDDQGLNQQALADLLAVSRPTLARLESGDAELTITQAQKLCDFFQIDLHSFLEGEVVAISEVTLDKSTEKEASQAAIRISVPQEKVTIFKEILLYILNQVGGKPNVGQTVLYKILYFIDFDFYEKYETQLIGASYIRNHHGPTPVEFKKIVQHMIADGDLEEVNSKYFSYTQKKYLPRRIADLSQISGTEKEHIDMELARLSNMTANELSALSHRDVPWITARQGEVLDYETVFYRTAETSQRAYDNAEL